MSFFRKRTETNDLSVAAVIDLDQDTMTDIDIARAARGLPITEIGERLGIPASHLIPFGHTKAKISNEFLQEISDRPNGRLILVTAMNPTPFGEGKTTTTVGLADALSRLGKKAALCIREPSLGPCFGMKGGAAGGGYSQVIPMEEINLHFTGDFHAVTAAHNLLTAMLDNHIHWGNALNIDIRRIVWRRVIDMNDRALRQIVCNLGGVANGYPREAGFDISVASEVMAILCLASDPLDLQERLGRIVVAYRTDNTPVYCRDLKADGAMAVLLQQAMQPNLVQTLEHTPAFVHGGPFANIAHGCNSVIATKAALKTAEYVVTEAGFGADLGAEKFLNIKCRQAFLNPDAAVVVATVRALKFNAGVGKDALSQPNTDAVQKGCDNLGRHIENLQTFNLPVVVAINYFAGDTPEELEAVIQYVETCGAKAVVATHWADGGRGAEDLANAVLESIVETPQPVQPTYQSEDTLFEKIEAIASRIYRADEVLADTKIRDQLKSWESEGYGHLPVCIAKTQYSFTTDPERRGAPLNHSLAVRDVQLSAGAGFIVVICGNIMRMPGLPKRPAAETIHLTKAGLIEGLF